MEDNKLFFHECRAAGLVFKTSSDWMNYLKEHEYDLKYAAAEHYGFKYNLNDVCLNPNCKVKYEVEGAVGYNFEVKTARTQYGWIWGYAYDTGTGGSSSPAAYPSRYDNAAIFYEYESEAIQDALSFIIRQLGGKAKTKNVSILLFYAKKMRADVVHPQMELFG